MDVAPFSSSSSLFSSHSCLVAHSVFCIPALGETKGKATTIREQDLSSLRRWSRSAVRETSFNSLFPPLPPFTTLSTTRCCWLGAQVLSCRSERARFLSVAISLIDKPLDFFFCPIFFSGSPVDLVHVRTTSLAPLSQFISYFLITHSRCTLLDGQSSIHRYHSPQSHTCSHATLSTSSMIRCLSTSPRPQERYNDRTNRFLTNTARIHATEQARSIRRVSRQLTRRRNFVVSCSLRSVFGRGDCLALAPLRGAVVLPGAHSSSGLEKKWSTEGGMVMARRGRTGLAPVVSTVRCFDTSIYSVFIVTAHAVSYPFSFCNSKASRC
ncbi:hypothetical protein OG21DRAFT_9917 [Imleria badia]|nr:hypothetical protein OG21DRAFT_9917 [Imleria badia]